MGQTESILQMKKMNDIYLNSLPSNKNLDWSELKAITYDNINMGQKHKFVFGR